MGVRGETLAKANYFAPQTLAFPLTGPWRGSLSAQNVNGVPKFADIPRAGTTIRRGRRELARSLEGFPAERIRRRGAGRPPLEKKTHPSPKT